MRCVDGRVSPETRVLFVAAAGPRRGYGHLVRCLSFARALGVRPLLAVRGGAHVEETALALGADVVKASSPRVVRALRPDVVVVDDPIARAAARWMAAARSAGALVVSVHDLGLGCRASDVLIDGSITRNARAAGHGLALTGSRFALLDPRVAAAGHRPRGDCRGRVLIALGGGPRVRLARAIAETIAAAEPRVEVRVAGGFNAAPRPAAGKIVWLGPTRGLVEELAQASTAIVAGGVSLYEACALGVPTVGLPVVPGQVPTVRAFGSRGAVIAAPLGASPDEVAGRALSVLKDEAMRRALARRARSLVDGRGAQRAAAIVAAMTQSVANMPPRRPTPRGVDRQKGGRR